jgi:hypothetical protein
VVEVANRIIFNVPYDFPKLEVIVGSEMMNRLRALGVVWDLTIMSHGHGRGGQQVDRAVEVVLYKNEQGNHRDALTTLITWLKSNKLAYTVLGDVGDVVG